MELCLENYGRSERFVDLDTTESYGRTEHVVDLGTPVNLEDLDLEFGGAVLRIRWIWA